MPSIETLNNIMTNHVDLLNANNVLEHDVNLVCPICLNKYDNNVHKESLEHVPQKSLGGKVIAITCNSCNNSCGVEIDRHLTNYIKRIENNEFVEGSDRFVVIDTPDGLLNAKLIVGNKDNLKLELNKTKNDPKTFEKRREFISKDSLVEIQNKSPQIKKDGLNAALLKNAYMILFAKFGYTFLSSEYYNRIREQIKNPTADIIPEGLWTLQKNIDIEDGVYLSNNNLYKGFFIVFTLKRIKEHRFMYYIPSPLIDVDIVAYYLRHIEKGDPLHLRKLGSIDYLLSVENIVWIKKWVENW